MFKSKHTGEPHKKVFTRWIESQLNIKVKDLISEIQNGHLLYHLVDVYFQPNLPFKYDENLKQRTKQNRSSILGIIEQILNYLREKNVRVTCVAEDILSGHVVHILNLIWEIISKIQNIQPNLLLLYVNQKLVETNIKVRDFSESFSDGYVFAHLLKYYAPESIDLEEFRQAKIPDGLKSVFLAAKQNLNIPRILEPADIFSEKPSEKLILLYLSYFRNLETSNTEQLSETTKTKIHTISTKFEKVNKSIVHVLSEKRSRSVSEKKFRPILWSISDKKSKPNLVPITEQNSRINADSEEIQTLKNEVENLKNLLAEQEHVIIQQDFLLRRKDKKLKKLSTQLNQQVQGEKTAYKKSEKRYQKVKNKLEISLKNEAELQRKFESEIQDLIQQQHAKQTELELVLQRAASHTKTVYELRTRVKDHYDHEQIMKSNEDLVTKVTILETEISESIKKTEELQIWLQEITTDSKIDAKIGPSAIVLSSKLTSAMARVTTTLQHYQQLKRELQQLAGTHGEMVAYVSLLDKELKKGKGLKE